jgi:VWFA-related protein
MRAYSFARFIGRSPFPIAWSLGCAATSFLLLTVSTAAQQAPVPPAQEAKSPAISVQTPLPPSAAGTATSGAPLRVSVNLVLVPVVVRDSAGHAIGTLRKEDFRILDNHKEQTISEFHVEESYSSNSSHPGNQSSSVGTSNAAFIVPARYTALFVDDIHMDPSDVLNVRKAMAHYLETAVSPEERVALFTASGAGQLDFARDANALQGSVNKLAPHPIGASNLKDCPDVSYYDADLITNRGDRDALDAATAEAMGACGIRDPKAAQAVARNAALRKLNLGDMERSAVLASLSATVKRLAAAPGQRTVVFVSPGFILTDGDDEQARIIENAVRQKIIVNTLDSRGLYVDAEDGGDLLQSNVMLELAGATGGTFFHNSNALDTAFSRLAQPPEFVYVLGFSPQEVKADGKFHKLKVELAAKSKLTLSARSGYYAPGGQTDSAAESNERLTAAIFSSSALHDLSVHLRTQFVKDDKPVARLTVSPVIDLTQLPVRQEQGHNRNELTIVTALFDSNGKYLTGVNNTVGINWSEKPSSSELSSGALPSSNFAVRPGDYLVRVVVREALSSHMSAETISVRIP